MYRNQQTFKIPNTHKFLSLENVRKIKENFQKNLLTFLSVKNFKRLVISIPKCIELNSELILVSVNICFYWGEKSDAIPISRNCHRTIPEEKKKS